MATYYSLPKAGDIVQCRFPQLPFDDERFAPSPNRRFSVHPKRGKLNLDDNDLTRRLSSAIAELKKAGRPKAVDMITRSAGRKKPKS